MPIRTCAERLRAADNDQAKGEALSGLSDLLERYPDQVPEHLASTRVQDIALVLFESSRMLFPNGQLCSNVLFRSLHPTNVVSLLNTDTDIESITNVLKAAALSAPEVCDATWAAASTHRCGNRTLADYACQHGGDDARRVVDTLRRRSADRVPLTDMDRAQMSVADAVPSWVSNCSQLLRDAPAAAEQHIRYLMQALNGLSVAERDDVLRRSDINDVLAIVVAAASLRLAPDTPPNTRQPGCEVFDTLPIDVFRECVEFHPEQTLVAAAMAQDVPTLGRIFHAAHAAQRGLCEYMSQIALEHRADPIGHIFDHGTDQEIAGLMNMVSKAESEIVAAAVVRRSAEHHNNPLRRLARMHEEDRHAVHSVARRSGLNPDETPSSPHYADIDSARPGSGPAADFRGVVQNPPPPAAPKPSYGRDMRR